MVNSQQTALAMNGQSSRSSQFVAADQTKSANSQQFAQAEQQGALGC